MSRLSRFIHAVASSYAVLAANALYTLASVPLALRYLSKEGFGVWAVVWQIFMYLLIVDFGLTPAISRLIVDVKDRKAEDAYARVVLTCWMTQAAAGAAVVALGLAVCPLLPALLKIPEGLRGVFLLMVRCQVGLLGVLFLGRIFEQMLAAHQRHYVSNYAQIAYFVAGFLTLCAGFRAGLGLLAMVVANGAAWVTQVSIQAAACRTFGLFPRRVSRASFSRPVFAELFRFGRDTFLTALGSQLTLASQVLVASRTLGLAVSATWAIATRLFFLAGQLVWRLFDASLPAFAEMIVRGERDRLSDRFERLVRLTGIWTACGAVAFAACNAPFLKLWTGGMIGWSRGNDVLLGVWMVILSVFHNYSVFIITTKDLRFMRYVCFLEGMCFVASGYLASWRCGIPGMLVCSIVCSLMFSGNYTHRRIAAYFNVSHSTVLFGWQKETAVSLAVLSTVGLVMTRLVAGLPAIGQLAILALALGATGMALVAGLGLPGFRAGKGLPDASPGGELT